MDSKLTKMREHKGLNTHQLSLLSNVAFATIKSIESNKSRPYWGTVSKLAKALNCDPYMIDGHVRRELKTCAVCKKTFEDSPSNENKTCSKTCSTKHRIMYSKKNRDIMKRAHAAISTSPKTGPFITNHCAKDWTLVSPHGMTYTFRNLSLWARKHEDMLPGSVKQFVTAIGHIKQKKLGKRKRAATQYKGWTINM